MSSSFTPDIPVQRQHKIQCAFTFRIQFRNFLVVSPTKSQPKFSLNFALVCLFVLFVSFFFHHNQMQWNTWKTHRSKHTMLQYYANKQVFAVFLFSNVSFRTYVVLYYFLAHFGDRVVYMYLVHTTNQTHKLEIENANNEQKRGNCKLKRKTKKRKKKKCTRTKEKTFWSLCGCLSRCHQAEKKSEHFST